MGCRILEELREHYPIAEIRAHVIFPLDKGESPLQHYNITLSLSSLQENADCIVYLL